MTLMREKPNLVLMPSDAQNSHNLRAAKQHPEEKQEKGQWNWKRNKGKVENTLADELNSLVSAPAMES
jgi:hypothetical protein